MSDLPGWPDRRHLHHNDYPETLRLLRAIVRGRDVHGFHPTEEGAFVSPSMLDESFLSTTEKAAVRLAFALATFEWHGPFDGELGRTCREATATVLSEGTSSD